MDIGDTIAPTSDQLDAVDLLSGPRTFTVDRVEGGSSEQPVNIHLAEFPRPWRPGKSMRRVLVNVWGRDGKAYAGRQLTLFCDETVRFGGQAVGGVRISHMSGIDKPKSTPLIVSRGKSALWTVEPLRQAPKPTDPTPEDIAASTDPDQLRTWWKTANPDTRALIEARGTEIGGA